MMACSVAPALPHEIFHRVGDLGAGGFGRVSKPRHHRTGAVFAGTEDEVAEVLRPVAPDSTCLGAPLEETRLPDLDWIGYLGDGGFARVSDRARHRRTSPVFAGTDDEVAEVLGPVVVGALEAAGVRGERRVRFDLPAEETMVAAPVEPWFPTGVLGEPPESLADTGPEMTAAFLASVIAADAGSSDAPTDRDDLVALWTERKKACSRRTSYLRDYCRFQREEDEESVPETMTTTLPAETDHVEEAAPPPRVKTGLAFDSPESEAEFVKAIRSRYLLKDDFA